MPYKSNYNKSSCGKLVFCGISMKYQIMGLPVYFIPNPNYFSFDQKADALLKTYPPFVNFYEKTKDAIVNCDKVKPRFHAFLKITQSKPECGRQTLVELFIRPVQRLPSTLLLLDGL